MTKLEATQYIHEVTDESPDSGLDPALERLLLRIRLRARRRVAWLRRLWREEGESGGKLAVSHAEIDTHLEGRDSPAAETAWLASDDSVQSLNRQLAKIEAAIAADQSSRLARLQHTFDLNIEDFDLLQTCLAVLLDPSLRRVYAYLHDHAGRGYSTEELAARLFGHAHSSLWSPESPLCRWKLIAAKDAGPGEPTQLICDPFIRDWVQGHNPLDQSLVGIARYYRPSAPLKDWPVEETAVFLKRMIDGPTPGAVRVRITGPSGSGRRTLAALLSAQLGMSLLAVDTDPIDEQNWLRVFVHAQRQAFLNQCALAWFGEGAVGRRWPKTVLFYPLQFVICEHGKAPRPIDGLIEKHLEIPEPSLDERRSLWRRFVPQAQAWPEGAFHQLATQHRVSVGEIIALARRDVQTVAEATDLIRESARYRLGNLAQLLECPFKWDDLVVTDHLREVLEDLTFEAGERVAFWERPEARRLFPQGSGLLGLFSGPPGTGKTMAAQVIAASLDLDLFRIDLSAVVSKYVGETSKNLERIFSRAAGMDIVLLFDEADALFGKRTEIKDAHDRFANTDTNYLLQAIEDYRGVALLSTNRKGNIDPAFIRRIRYVVEFAKPDAKQRKQIWRRIVGELTGAEALDALGGDLQALAKDLELTGAQIKFAVLAALFAARRDKKPLAMSHLLRGVDRELMKEGRALSGRERERLIRGG